MSLLSGGASRRMRGGGWVFDGHGRDFLAGGGGGR